MSSLFTSRSIAKDHETCENMPTYATPVRFRTGSSMMDSSKDKSEEEALTIPAFVAGVLKIARDQKNSDHELLDILENHIVNTDVADDSPAKALQDIVALAESRASIDTSNNSEDVSE